MRDRKKKPRRLPAAVFLLPARSKHMSLTVPRVVIIDPSWNPADDLQAMDRAFRMGQTRDVNVYRLVAGDTIEEVCHRSVLQRRELMSWLSLQTAWRE